MCGIAGIYRLNEKRNNNEGYSITLKRMLDLIAHRGPDGEGTVILDDGTVFLGHRRLAIIDLSDNAKQPMCTIDGRYTITYNGELYNYRELRNELIRRNYVFKSNSDTEVVLYSYAEWGPDALKGFNGIFAFAIWDSVCKNLLLACDRYGTKPVYYTLQNDHLVFASEYKSILAFPNIKRDIDFCALKQYFTFQNIFDNRTLIKDVFLLSPGSYIIVNSNSKSIHEVKYWEFDFEEEREQLSQEEYEDRLDYLFRQAVNRQLISDVPVGSYLSGGIDSGSLTAIASQKMKNMRTFTCGFDLRSASGIELQYDERDKAEYMSHCFRTEHYEMVLKSGDMERCMKKLIWHLEDPRVGQCYPNYYMALLASKFVKVVLAGTGGDEIFAGYPWRYYRVADSRDYEDYVNKYFQYWQRLLLEDDLKEVFSGVYDKMDEYSMYQTFRNVLNVKEHSITPEKCVNYSLLFEAKTFLRGLLIVEDKLSMAHGLETRVPFLDNDLVDFAMHLPIKYKLLNTENRVMINENDYESKKEKYYRKTNDGKRILRSVMTRYIPREISDDVKRGFSAPDASWFRGESIDYVKSIIDNGNSRIYGYMSKNKVQELVKLHFEGVENRRLLIWSIISFEEWLRQFA